MEGNVPQEQDAWWGHVPGVISVVTGNMVIGYKDLILEKVDEAMKVGDVNMLPPSSPHRPSPG